MDEAGLTVGEQKALEFLEDRNKVQRTVIVEKSGKRKTIEKDVSGGLDALIALLNDTERPLPPSLRIALARALSPNGRSVLVISKRLRRAAGRPPKRDAEKAYAIHSSEIRIASATNRLKKSRPIPAVGMKAKPASKAEAIKATKFGRTATYENRKELAKFKRKPKKPNKN